MAKKNDIQTELTRVPQSLAFDTDALLLQYDKQAIIIKDLLLFVVKRQLTLQDIFGHVSFTIDDFCQDMGYSKSEMYRTLEDFNAKKKAPTLDGHVFDGLFEYALYRGLKENVVFHRKDKEGFTVNSVQLFKQVEVLYNKNTKKNTRRTYSIILGNDIMEAIFKSYFVLDYNDYRNLAVKSSEATGAYRNFYIYYARMIATCRYHNNHSFITSVDELCRIFNYNFSENKYKKKHIGKSLNYIQKSISLSFNYRFIRHNGSKYAYHIYFEFSDEVLNAFDEKLLSVFFKRVRDKTWTSFIINQTKNEPNYSAKTNIEQNASIDDYYKWFFSSEDSETKRYIIKELTKELFPIGPE
jgi:hypothetical protein